MPRVRHLLPLACLSLAASAAQALSFSEAYEYAVAFDAQIRAAGYERDAARRGVPVARSSLLPSVGASLSTTSVTGTRQFPNALNQDVSVYVEYTAPQYSLSMRAPLVNFEGISRLRQAQAIAEGAEFSYRVRGADLVDRLGSAYLQVLLSTDSLELAKAQVLLLQAQLERSENRFKKGEGTRTDVAQTQASLDIARARVLELADALTVAWRSFRRITGYDRVPLNQVQTDFMPQAPQPELLEDWLVLARANSPNLRVREQAVEAARQAVARNRAGHLPRLDLVANWSQSKNESISFLNQSANLKSVGLQLNVPLYSGGGTEASVEQSQADLARAEEELRAERESIELEVQRNHAAVTSSVAKVQALRRAVESADLAMVATRVSTENGYGTTADVLDAQTRRYAAARDLAQARYEYVAARMRLLLQSGTPLADVVGEINRLLPLATPADKNKAP